jgi:hypothetical protein
MISQYSFFLLLFSFFFYHSDSSFEQVQKEYQLATPVSINYKQKVVNEDEGVSIKFINVISDSRCPTGVECVWAGEAELQFIAAKVNDSIKFNLFSSGRNFGQDTILFNLHIRLLEVTPYPQVSKSIALEDYKAKIIVEKLKD